MKIQRCMVKGSGYLNLVVGKSRVWDHVPIGERIKERA
jgi:hypothetical protein